MFYRLQDKTCLVLFQNKTYIQQCMLNRGDYFLNIRKEKKKKVCVYPYKHNYAMKGQKTKQSQSVLN